VVFLREERGLTLIELLTTVAILGMVLSVAVPSWMSLRRRAAVRSASAEIRSVFHEVRSRAITRSSNSGVLFTRSGSQWQFAVYDDGDRDGVRNDDIRRGIDTLVSPPRFLLQQPHLVTVGLLPRAIRDPWLLSLASPVVLFVHPWEFVDLTRERLRLDCRFRTGNPAVVALRDVVSLFHDRGARFARMREFGPAERAAA